MVSDFRKKKLVHIFNVFFDTDKSGSVDKKDFDLVVEKAAKLRGWKVDDTPYKVLKDTIDKVWEGLQGADVNKDGEVSLDEWISLWDNYARNPSSAPEWQKVYAKFIFQLEDSSNDGSIDSEEFSSVYASYGLDKSEAVTAFGKMSKGKANVTWEEFEKLWNEYFTSEDPNAPGNFIFGKTSF